MSEPPSGAGGLSPGDPLAGDPAAGPPRRESGLPGIPPAPERPAPGPGYSSPPPPGAGGPIAPASHGDVMGRYVLASWGSRAAAQVVDGIIIGLGARDRRRLGRRHGGRGGRRGRPVLGALRLGDRGALRADPDGAHQRQDV